MRSEPDTPENPDWLPRRDHLEQRLESEREFCDRVRAVFPRIPSDVLGQWFYDHDEAVLDWFWLDLWSLRFELQQWTVHRFVEVDFGNDAVDTYLYHLREGDRAPRVDRIESYFRKNGTWPRPIIMLRATQGMKAPWGLDMACPHQILEGHHRLAVCLDLQENRVSLNDEHEVWVVSRETA